MHGAGNDAADPWNAIGLLCDRDHAGRRADYVDDGALGHARSDGIPVRVECAHRNRNTGAKSKAVRPDGAETSGEVVRCAIAAAELCANPSEQRIYAGEKVIGW